MNETEQRMRALEDRRDELAREQAGHTGRATQLAEEGAGVAEISEQQRLAGKVAIEGQKVHDELRQLRTKHERGLTE